MLSKSIGLINVVRRAPSCSLAGIQKSHFSQNFNFDVKEEVRALEINQKCNIFGSNVLFKQRIVGLSCRTFTRKVTKESGKKKQKNELPEIWLNLQWKLIVAFPGGIFIERYVKKMKFFYKCISAVMIPWATYSYTTGYLSMNYLAATYGSILIVPLTLYALSRVSNRLTLYILMDKSNKIILVGYISAFLKLKEDVVPIDDIYSLSAAEKMGKNIQGLVISKKSNKAEWFYVPSECIKIFDKEKAEKIFHNLDLISKEVYKKE